jgi:hypothetical protein
MQSDARQSSVTPAEVRISVSSKIQSLSEPDQVTITDMLLAILGMRLLTLIFFVGLVGSAVVVLISFWEDGKELFGKD